jgi:hypothetical protein
MNIKPIDQQLRPLLDEFLLLPALQDRFAEIAKELGYNGSDPEKIRISLFSLDGSNEIIFASQEVYDAFLDFQILKQLSLVEPYATLMKYFPETHEELLCIAKDMLAGKEIEVDRVLSLFPKPDPTELKLETQ